MPVAVEIATVGCQSISFSRKALPVGKSRCENNLLRSVTAVPYDERVRDLRLCQYLTNSLD